MPINPIPLCLVLVVLAACGGSDEKTTPATQTKPAPVQVNPHLKNGGVQVIEGVIRNSPLRNLVLQEVIPPTDPQQPPQVNVLAQTTLGGNDSFHFEVKLTEPQLATLTFDPAHSAELILQGGTLYLSADYREWGDRQVSGDAHNASLTEFAKRFNALNDDIRNYQASRSMQGPEARKEIERRVAETESFIREYADSTSCLGCGVHAALILNPSQHVDFLQRFREKLVATWPGSKYVGQLDSRMGPLMKWIGQFAPDIRLNNPEGRMVPLSSLRGKYVLVDFWASWCVPCRMENPNVVKLYNQYRNRGFTVYSVSLDGGQTRTTKTEWVAAIKQDKLAWDTHVSDLMGWQSPVAREYEVNSIPASFLLDKEGRILAKDLRGEALERKLASLFR
jgi:thiol-disulfide isomerase/thioredoxin